MGRAFPNHLGLVTGITAAEADFLAWEANFEPQSLLKVHWNQQGDPEFCLVLQDRQPH